MAQPFLLLYKPKVWLWLLPYPFHLKHTVSELILHLCHTITKPRADTKSSSMPSSPPDLASVIQPPQSTGSQWTHWHDIEIYGRVVLRLFERGGTRQHAALSRPFLLIQSQPRLHPLTRSQFTDIEQALHCRQSIFIPRCTRCGINYRIRSEEQTLSNETFK